MVKRIRAPEKPAVIDLHLIADVPAEWKEELQQRVWASMIADGYASRLAGRPADAIEMRLLRDPDMAASWRMGWHRADEELKAKKGKK